MFKKLYTLMLHGGSGPVADKGNTLPSILKVLKSGESLLQQGASAVEVVTHCVSLLEDDPLFNAGRGAVLNGKGKIDLDASVMSGIDMAAGAIAGVEGIKNPVQLARVVMEKSEHVLLIGRGAESFAKLHGIACESPEYFLTESRVAQWKAAKASNKVVLDHVDVHGTGNTFGTVGAVARDVSGNLAAATSTGGIVNKKYGRVGDTPLIGSGTYAEDGICAVSATGYGEQLMRTVIAKHIADIIRYQKVDAQTAAQLGIDYLVRAVKGLGGVIVIDAQGKCGQAYSTQGMIYGSVSNTQEPQAALQ
jgi:L-asparaginase / beta-aspartyl-peptidase